ncbi:MAG: hypothetical protein FWE64_03310 [Alphaproteobacteria bacterium]|nr:hypothetical protein [Alphaproteobacteria bacterium]
MGSQEVIQEAANKITTMLLNEITDAFNKTLETSIELADAKAVWDIFNSPNKGSLTVRQFNLLETTLNSFFTCYDFIRNEIEENPEQYIQSMMKLGLTPPQFINLLIEKLSGYLIMGEKRMVELRPCYISALKTAIELGAYPELEALNMSPEKFIESSLEMIDRLDGNPLSARDSMQIYEALSQGKTYPEYLAEKNDK